MAAMRRFRSYDGTELAYHVQGRGRPLVCLPGGPGRSSAYFGDLGGLSAHRTLVLLDNRGTGDSAVPADRATYRADRLADDVEALRAHLGLAELDLLGHSAGAGVAMRYAAEHPAQLARLVLVTPGLLAIGIDLTPEDWLASLGARSGEPWFPGAYQSALLLAEGDERPETYRAVGPFYYGRWDDAAAAHFGSPAMGRSAEVMAGYYADGAFDPSRVRAGLTMLTAPVLVLAGELDPGPSPASAARLTALFPRAELVIQPGAGHYPWLDDSGWFVDTLATFLG